MKKDIHPDYNSVVFEDVSTGFRFITGSTLTSEETTKWEDGKSYPLIKVEISSSSHPFYTGKQMLVDTAGRVDKFKEKMAKVEEASKGKKGKTAKRKAKAVKKEVTEEKAEKPKKKAAKKPEVKKEEKSKEEK